ncbi:MAG: hypothetical protein LBT14_02915 [Treponema sp.]|jgi:hypothetical protein|nr:hypothetical protein [Treponema sp.]
MHAKVVLCRCQKTKQLFGIRIEERNRDWYRTWAFKLDEKKAQREKFDTNQVTGSLMADAAFPGCPYCGNHEFFQCSCDGGKLTCYDGTRSTGTCAWCGGTADLVSTEQFKIKGGSY